jgi:hypothetical protein
MNQVDPSPVAGAIAIRPATADDLDALCAQAGVLSRNIGPSGFAIPYPPADLALFERDAYGPAKVASELADATHATWVAVAGDGALVGYAHMGPCKLPHDDLAEGDHELYQLYLRRAAQGRAGAPDDGYGDGVESARTLALGGRALWLGVWSGNDRAQRVSRAWLCDRGLSIRRGRLAR